MFLINATLILLTVAWWFKSVPQRSWLSSLIISFGLGLLTIEMQSIMLRMSSDHEAGIVDQIAAVWFFAICALCAQIIWNDRWSKSRIRRVPKEFRRPVE